MKNILCFGDSNMWGWNPEGQARFERHERWTGILQAQLGADYYIIEEGLSGRTTVFDDPIEPGRNGSNYLYPCLITHKPLDLVILALGTNDTKAKYQVSPFEIGEGMALLVSIVLSSGAGRNDQAPPILIVSPPHLSDIPSPYDEMFADGRLKSERLAGYYQEVATRYGCSFWDAAPSVKVGIDGIHLNAENQQNMAKGLLGQISAILG